MTYKHLLRPMSSLELVSAGNRISWLVQECQEAKKKADKAMELDNKLKSWKLFN